MDVEFSFRWLNNQISNPNECKLMCAWAQICWHFCLGEGQLWISRNAVLQLEGQPNLQNPSVEPGKVWKLVYKRGPFTSKVASLVFCCSAFKNARMMFSFPKIMQHLEKSWRQVMLQLVIMETLQEVSDTSKWAWNELPVKPLQTDLEPEEWLII